MTKRAVCDFCDRKNVYNFTDWGTISLSLKIGGKRPLEDICPYCSYWLYEMVDIRRKLVAKLNQYDNEIPKNVAKINECYNNEIQEKN